MNQYEIDWADTIKWPTKYTRSLAIHGYMLISSGKYADAKSVFEIIHCLHPRNVEYIKALGIIHLKENDILQASKLFQKAMDIDPHDRIAKLNYIRSALALHNIETAHAFALDALKDAENDAERSFISGIMQIIKYLRSA